MGGSNRFKGLIHHDPGLLIAKSHDRHSKNIVLLFIPIIQIPIKLHIYNFHKIQSTFQTLVNPSISSSVPSATRILGGYKKTKLPEGQSPRPFHAPEGKEVGTAMKGVVSRWFKYLCHPLTHKLTTCVIFKIENDIQLTF